MTELNLLYFQAFQKTLMSLPVEAWAEAESLIETGAALDDIALIIAEKFEK